MFVESVLRYGLPVNFQGMILLPQKKTQKKLRDSLNQLYVHLDSAGGSGDVRILKIIYLKYWARDAFIFHNTKYHSLTLQHIQHILKHFYYTALQKFCRFGALSRPENQCKCHKDS